MRPQQLELGVFDSELRSGSANDDAPAAADWVDLGDDHAIVGPANVDADSTARGLHHRNVDGDQYQHRDDDDISVRPKTIAPNRLKLRSAGSSLTGLSRLFRSPITEPAS